MGQTEVSSQKRKAAVRGNRPKWRSDEGDDQQTNAEITAVTSAGQDRLAVAFVSAGSWPGRGLRVRSRAARMSNRVAMALRCWCRSSTACCSSGPGGDAANAAQQECGAADRCDDLRSRLHRTPPIGSLSWIRRSAHAAAGQQRRDRDAENAMKNPSSYHASAHLWCALYLAPSFDIPAANSQQ